MGKIPTAFCPSFCLLCTFITFEFTLKYVIHERRKLRLDPNNPLSEAAGTAVYTAGLSKGLQLIFPKVINSSLAVDLDAYSYRLLLHYYCIYL